MYFQYSADMAERMKAQAYRFFNDDKLEKKWHKWPSNIITETCPDKKLLRQTQLRVRRVGVPLIFCLNPDPTLNTPLAVEGTLDGTHDPPTVAQPMLGRPGRDWHRYSDITYGGARRVQVFANIFAKKRSAFLKSKAKYMKFRVNNGNYRYYIKSKRKHGVVVVKCTPRQAVAARKALSKKSKPKPAAKRSSSQPKTPNTQAPLRRRKLISGSRI